MRKGKEYLFTVLGCWAIVLLISIGLFGQVQAQQRYPSKPIEIIVPYPAGGGTDMSARVLADYLNKKWGVTVTVVNKPGGATVPGVLELYSARPDGYTVLQDGMASSSQLIAVVKDPPFKIMERTFMGIFAAVPYIYIVHPDSPIKSMRDIEAEAKKDPGNFTWTSMGGVSAIEFSMMKFMKAIGLDIKKTKAIASKGGSEAVTQVTSGLVKVGLCSFTAGAPAISAKIVRPLAVTADKRLQNFPGIPTIIEAGYPTATNQDRYGPSGPPKVPSTVIEVWEKALGEMQKDPEVISKLARIGQSSIYINARDTRELVLKEMEETKEFCGLQ